MEPPPDAVLKLKQVGADASCCSASGPGEAAVCGRMQELWGEAASQVRQASGSWHALTAVRVLLPFSLPKSHMAIQLNSHRKCALSSPIRATAPSSLTAAQ